jgi:hypothetical protein
MLLNHFYIGQMQNQIKLSSGVSYFINNRFKSGDGFSCYSTLLQWRMKSAVVTKEKIVRWIFMECEERIFFKLKRFVPKPVTLLQ